MTTSNSQIYSSSVFGSGNGLTKLEQNEKITKTIETALLEQQVAKLSNALPRTPSYSKTLKDKKQ